MHDRTWACKAVKEISVRCFGLPCMNITGGTTATSSMAIDYFIPRFLLLRFQRIGTFQYIRSPVYARKNKKKKTSQQYTRSARFFGTTANVFQARRKKLTVRHRLLTGKPVVWLDTALSSCAHVPCLCAAPRSAGHLTGISNRSVSKNGICYTLNTRFLHTTQLFQSS